MIPNSESLQTSSLNHTAISPTTTSANTHSEPTIIQPQIESNNSVSTLEIVPNSESLQTSSPNHIAIASTNTSTNTRSELTVIQPQLESTDSVSIVEKVADMNNLSSLEPNPALIHTNISTIIHPESTAIQPQLKSDDSVSIAEKLPDINSSVATSSANTTFVSKNTPVSSKVETPLIKLKKETPNPNHISEIPQLPIALKKISIFSPLSQTSSLLASNVADETASLDASTPISLSPSLPHHIQKSPMKEIPNSWSSLAELLGESTTVDNSQKTIVQPFADERHEFTSIASTQSEYSQSEPKTHYSQTRNSRQVIQAYTDPSSSSLQNIEETDNEVTITNESLEDECENLEVLAREIYKMLQYRLEIERERRGKNYSGRLPW